MTLDEIAIRRALTHLGILDGYRDVSSYEAFVETADADGIRERYGRELPTEQELFKALAEADQASDPPKRRFSFLEFMDLFKEPEQLTLVEASMTFPAIKLWYDRAVGAQFIDLDDPRTEAGLQKLVDESLISAERKVSVMAGKGPA
ncbi:hypothetical protein [Microvirga arsenatis]|uniref:Uncharacterized protein n=1 Tax=Microvirga arsenatis TaxID=2692265 RepID=A0ABW9YZB7_9HYPH|nr:hypothetical protein [Microvirga arsenatis]NBJ13190.1 hypothetical protein [Microvirga arsenatis]NBJ25172.1 hypothetical protein [Microvirga arsenatis]